MIKELLEITIPTNRIRLDSKNKAWLEKIALRHLNLSSLNALRDRYEGQAYLNRFLMNSYAEIALEKLLEISFISEEDKETMKGYRPEIIYRGLKIELVVSDFDTYPAIPKGNYDFAVIAFVNLSIRDVLLAGAISASMLKKSMASDQLTPFLTKTHLGYLKDFNKLISISEIGK